MVSSDVSYLLDTQIGLWLLLADDRLNEANFRERFKSTNSRFIFHQTSIWEIEIKYDLGKLPLPRRPGPWLIDVIMKSGLDYQRIDDSAIFSLGKLPALHRDPFDRMLVAHALINSWTLVSADPVLEGYPVKFELV